MNVQILTVPYDSAHREARMGRGPAHLIRKGLAETLRKHGHAVDVTTVAPTGRFPAEITTAIELCRALSPSVAAAQSQGRFPIVLAGNCSTAVGTIAGVGAARTGVIWLDAHGDFNTPDTTTSGFFDGTVLAAVTGHCWRGLVASVPAFQPIPESNIILLGARDLDPAERQRLARSKIARVEPLPADRIARELRPHLQRLRDTVEGVYLHIDLDVLDPSVARANMFSAPGGLTSEALTAVVREVEAHLPISALALTAYDPSCDEPQQIPDIANAIVSDVLASR